MRLSPFTPVLRLLCFGYHLPVQNGRTGNEATYVTVPFVCRADDPRLWLSYQAIQLSSSYADFHSYVQRALGDFIYRCTPAGVIWQQHAALPIRFPHPDKLWNDRLFSFSPSFLDIFAYRLLKAVSCKYHVANLYCAGDFWAHAVADYGIGVVLIDCL